MSTLNIRMTEDKNNDNSCKVVMFCTNDIKDDILKTTKLAYEIELLQGEVVTGKAATHIAFTLTCPEKINTLKEAIHTAYMKANGQLNYPLKQLKDNQ